MIRDKLKTARGAVIKCFIVFSAAALFPSQAVPGTAYAGGEDHGGSHAEGLHFSHPLIAESPTPDTKLRLDYYYRDIDGAEEKGTESAVRVEFEHAFHRSFGIEIDAAYVNSDPDDEENVSSLDNIELGFKFANFAFEEHGVVLGYGLEFGLPTGSDDKGIGSDHIFEIEPFLSFGYREGGFEAVAFASFGIPTNQEEGEEVETEFGYNLAVQYRFTPAVSGILELDGETVLSGHEDGTSIVNLTPGLIVRPFEGKDLAAGLAVSFPVSDEEEFSFQTLVSLFYHF